MSFYLKKKIRNNYKIEIISRAYHAGVIASVIKSKVKKINHNFDPRSLYPEESVTVQKWSFGGKIYQNWKKQEKFILHFTDKVSVVTPEMYQWFKSEGFKGEISLKHFNIDEKIFNLEISEPGLSNFYREKFNIRPDTIVFGFLGSLGSSRQWNSIYPYIKHLNSLYQLVGKNIEFCFAIKSSWLNKIQKTELTNSLKCKVIFLEDLSIEESLSFFNLGCHIMLDGPDNITRVGIKVYEYLAAGLPILTNSSAGAACNLSKKMGGFIDIMSIYELDNHIVDDLKRMTKTNHRILIRKNFLKYLKEFKI
ncbi:Hypothetical protein A9601_14201 [Prochlorococcus marinus str. AS9601]|uniref:Glycosyl transferase family 1 domain-containing protein n=1 Tax=Prochlorococcus marinus (strain AS9601) TaxID=146891 RepID=A2BSE3_PROMS|nr:Hypothetical protein A9601_14201 [Prochlorococcus marinus str. AS9601]